MRPFTLAGTATSIILGFAKLRLSIISAYWSGEDTCNLGLFFFSFSILENFLLSGLGKNFFSQLLNSLLSAKNFNLYFSLNITISSKVNITIWKLLEILLLKHDF